MFVYILYTYTYTHTEKMKKITFNTTMERGNDGVLMFQAPILSQFIYIFMGER